MHPLNWRQHFQEKVKKKVRKTVQISGKSWKAVAEKFEKREKEKRKRIFAKYITLRVHLEAAFVHCASLLWLVVV